MAQHPETGRLVVAAVELGVGIVVGGQEPVVGEMAGLGRVVGRPDG